MARLVFLSALLAATVVYATSTTPKMTVHYGCNDEGCNTCPSSTTFTTTTDDTCTNGVADSYKAICTAEGAWTLKTFQGADCNEDNIVYTFTSTSATEKCKEADKSTIVKYLGKDETAKLKLKVCVLVESSKYDTCKNEGFDCPEVEVPNSGNCESISVGSPEKTYFFKVTSTSADDGAAEARVAKAAEASTTISIYATSDECANGGLPLMHWEGATTEGEAQGCHAYNQQVKVECPAETTSTTSPETTSTTSPETTSTTSPETTSTTSPETTSTTGPETTSPETTPKSPETTPKSPETTPKSPETTTGNIIEFNNTTSEDSVTGVTTMLAIFVIAAATTLNL